MRYTLSNSALEGCDIWLGHLEAKAGGPILRLQDDVAILGHYGQRGREHVWLHSSRVVDCVWRVFLRLNFSMLGKIGVWNDL